MPTSTPATFYDLPSGGRLRGDAAASLLRMRAAGMPSGGIDVYSRTLAQQAYLRKLYEQGKGPLAARPSPTAPHIKGVAIDAHTTTAGKYAPSEAHRWLTAGGDGSSKPKSGEKLRCHPYGWRRTVPSERWHFAYDPAKDTKAAADLAARLKVLGVKDVKTFQRSQGLTVDGKAGPQTWTALLLAADAAPKPDPVDPAPPEVPVPVPPISADFRFGLANLQAQRFGGLADTSPRRGQYLRDKMACSLYVLTEVPEKSRDAIRKILGAAWKVYPVGYSTVMWDSAKWIHRDRMAVDFGTGIHGAVRAELRHAATGLPLDVIGVHVRPAASFGGDQAKADKGKQADIAKMLSLYRKGVSTIIAGDFNTPDTAALARAGLVRATPAVDTLDKAGVQPLDQVWVSPDLTVRGTTLLDPGSLTDHKVWVAQLTLGGSAL